MALIAGGGVAGIAAAVALADAGFGVKLIEKRPLLGGRASSHIDPHTGDQIDECQHGTMRCCTCLADLFERLGVSHQIRYHETLRFLDGDGRRSSISSCILPAPLHTSLSFLVFRALGLKDKIAISRGMLAMLRAKSDASLQHTTIACWFAAHGQTERAIRRFWAPILVSATNETIDRISCFHAFKIFLEGFLLNSRAYHFGIPRVPLGTLYTQPTQEYLAARGGEVRLKTIVEEIRFEGQLPHRVTGVRLQTGEELNADYYVSALQQDLLLKMLPEAVTAGGEYWERLRNIEVSPIIGVHLWFDRAIDCPEALALLDRETEWIFNKTLNFDAEPAAGCYLSTVISASRRYAGVSKEEILATVIADVNACLPQTRDAKLLKWQVIKWPKATFSPVPGVEQLRPDQQSPISNLLVAGEWTRTGWPSTMESAARSGYRAAEYVLKQEGIEATIVPPGLSPGWLAKLITRPQPPNSSS